MRPEVELLICCARTAMSPKMAEQIRMLLQEDIDWAYLYRMASLHGMMPLLYWHLNGTSPEAVPKASMDYLRDYFHANAGHNLFLTGELCQLLKLLDANGIHAIPFRGPALAASVYGDLMLRQFSDLDILVLEQDVTAATELLVSQGYRPRLNLTRVKESSFLQYHSDYLFLHSKDRFIVEILLRILSLRLDSKSLWKRLEPLSLGGYEVVTLPPEDLLLMLCVHGVRYLWEGLPWICDVAILAGHHKELDWRRLLEQAAILSSKRMLFLGLYLASDLLGAALPGEVLQRVQGDAAVKRLGAQVRERLFLETGEPPGALEISLFHLKARERLQDRIRYCFSSMSPNHGDREFLSLPSFLSFLTYLFRPIRIFQNPVLDLAPYVNTPMEVVERMLALAGVGPTDVVYDLGCGDGRIVITAAKRYGVRAVGVDLDPRRIADAKANARKEGVEHLVRFIHQDAKTVDVSGATVVTLFLTWPANLKLRQKFQWQLEVGTRIVSRNFDMADWAPEKTEILPDARGAMNTLYLWRVANAPTQTSCVTETSTSLGPIFLTQQDE